PLVIVSVPASFIGALLQVKESIFFIILGTCLIVASFLLWIKPNVLNKESALNIPDLENSIIGGCIGFISGLVGIGGGIFLSPILHFIQWSDAKRIAATASFFILVNSLAGIGGHLTNFAFQIDISQVVYLALAVLIGGQIGSRIGANNFNLLIVRRVTAVLVFVASIEVLSKHLSF
ncbi:MAG TPA: sulfite exporter TauE/SafE family protein, partial [Chitinophagaceae bacterium]|nr:sulfite exporter TauE/SafE family protein [Chitinophagaceae bacterium]